MRPSDYSTLNSLTDFILIVLLMSTSWTAAALLSQDYLKMSRRREWLQSSHTLPDASPICTPFF